MKTYKLQADCLVIRGYTRSTLCDITRRQVYIIDSYVAQMLQKGTFTESELHSIPKDVQQSLFDNGIIFECPAQLLAQFPPINQHYDSPYGIEDAIIDYDCSIKPHLKSIIAQLDEQNCRCVQIRFLPHANISEITDVLHHFNNSNVAAIEVMADSHTILAHHIENECDALISIIAYAAEGVAFEQRAGCTIISVSQAFTGASQCGVVEPQQFNCNREFFFLSGGYNTCLYRKVAIDREGYIRSCPASPQRFGRVGETPIAGAMSQPGFRRLWGITKDRVDVCRDCEFRRICPDCRVFTRNPERPTAHPARCAYNPYLARWAGQAGYAPVEECGEFTPGGFVPDAERIARLAER